MTKQSQSRRHHPQKVVALFFLLCSLLMLTYNGKIIFNDELQMADTTTSLIEFGDQKYDEAFWYVWDRYGASSLTSDGAYALPESPIEPGLSVVGIPFYWLGQHISSVGAAHLLLLTNIVISALACTVFYVYAIELQYDERTAFIAAMLLGFATIIWPYSRTFLRESLAMLLLLSGALCLEIYKTRRRVELVVVCVLLLAAGFFTKEALPTAFLGLGAIIAPRLIQSRRVEAAMLIFLLILPPLLIVSDVVASLIEEPIPIIGSYTLDGMYFRTALHSYLYSVGGSLWGTSPILLLSIGGAWYLWYERNTRYIWVTLLSLYGFAFAHALTVGKFWSGGATLPPRFMLPVLPLVFLPALAFIQKLAKQPTRNLWLWIVLGGLTIYSLFWQVMSVFISWLEYFERLPAESGGFAEWLPGINRLAYIRPVLLLDAVGKAEIELIWTRTETVLPPLLLGLFAVWSYRLYAKNTAFRWQVLVLPIVFVVILGVSMRAIFSDPEYLGEKQALFEIAAIIDEVEQPNDVVLLSSTQYQAFFFNYTNFHEARVVTLSLPPGERGSFEERPDVDVSDLNTLLDPVAVQTVNNLAAQRDRLWYLVDTGPFLPWSIRPMERYLVQNYFHVQTIETDPTVRLLEFATSESSEDIVGVDVAAVFADEIVLSEVALPAGQITQVGEVLPMTLHWQVIDDVNVDYTVAVFLADSAGNVIAQGQDSAPLGGFSVTSSWEEEDVFVDNRAVRIPNTAVRGDYELWVRLYRFENGEIINANVDGESVRDSTIAVLPTTITIR